MTKIQTSFAATQNPKILQANLLEKYFFGQHQIRMRLENSELVEIIKPGQFINIKTSDSFSPLLRRPFSIHRINRQQKWFEILFQIIGSGTQNLADWPIGKNVEFIGPLGNSFSIDEKLVRAVLIAGGLGIAPLLFLSQELINKNISVVLFWGNRSKDAFAIVPDFERGGVKTYLATDDGSLGFKGTITELFQTQFQALNRSRVEIFACGPNVMLQQLKQISAHANLPCQVSLETMMACGFGACMGCNVSSNLEPDGFKYVCKHGPVFNTGEIEISD